MQSESLFKLSLEAMPFAQEQLAGIDQRRLFVPRDLLQHRLVWTTWSQLIVEQNRERAVFANQTNHLSYVLLENRGRHSQARFQALIVFGLQRFGADPSLIDKS